ncbi:hypothetical protein ACHWQZ_G004203 [Mnemiopsis leidyi]
MLNGRIQRRTIIIFVVFIAALFLIAIRENLVGNILQSNISENKSSRSSGETSSLTSKSASLKTFTSTSTTPAQDEPLYKCNIENITGTNSVQIECVDKETFHCEHTPISESSTCTPQLRKPAKNQNCSSQEDFKKVMMARRSRQAEVCTNKTSRLHFSDTPPRELFHFHGVGGSGVTWCPVYKAASSNTNSYFCPLYYDEAKCADKTRNGANMWRFSEFFPPDQRDVPRFLVVRDPFERVLSAYRDKIEGPGALPFLDLVYYKILEPYRLIPSHAINRKQELLKEAWDRADSLLKVEDNRGMKGRRTYIENSENPYENPLSATFEEFLRALLTGTNNEHWDSIESTCTPCSPDSYYTYILTVEDYDCELNNMLGALGAGELQGLHRKYYQTNRNPRRGEEGQMRDLYEYYGAIPPDLLRAFYEWYRGDCELFGYDCERTMCEIEEWKRRFSTGKMTSL